MLDLGAQYQINKNLKVFANLYNVTDSRYQDIGGIYGNTYNMGQATPAELVGEAWFPMPSRTILVGVEYTF